MSRSNAPRDRDGTLSKVRRYPADGWVAGVCAGIADYFGWSVKLIRVLLILGLVFSGFFPVGVLYLVLWYLMDPAEGSLQQEPPAADGSTAAAGPRGSAPSPADLRARFEKLERRLQQIEACVTQDELDLRRQFRQLQT